MVTEMMGICKFFAQMFLCNCTTENIIPQKKTKKLKEAVQYTQASEAVMFLSFVGETEAALKRRLQSK